MQGAKDLQHNQYRELGKGLQVLAGGAWVGQVMRSHKSGGKVCVEILRASPVNTSGVQETNVAGCAQDDKFFRAVARRPPPATKADVKKAQQV